MSILTSEYICSQLLHGIRKEGYSMVECYLAWEITDKEYLLMLENNIELQRAHEIGEMHCAAWWHDNCRKLASKGNASVLALGMKNVLGWQDKPDTTTNTEIETLRAIEISILPPREEEDD